MTKIVRAFEYTNRDEQVVRFSVSDDMVDHPDSTAMTIMYLMMKDDRVPEGEAGEWLDTVLSGRNVYQANSLSRSSMSEARWKNSVKYLSLVDFAVVTENEIFYKAGAVEVLYATCKNLRVLTFEWHGGGKLLDVLEQDTIDNIIDVWEPYEDHKDDKFLTNIG